MESNLINKILDYEETIFNEFIQKRTNLIKNINNLKIDNKVQWVNCINDIKCIIDPIKNVNILIDQFGTNLFQDNKSINENNFILFYLIFKDFFLTTISSEPLDSSVPSELTEPSVPSEPSESSEPSEPSESE